ncbi:hypothetical protein [Geopsychrobacter electrodiphilus]|uniref:hypothetical protein n=1 Tax=Geopsychrobacter electrodiphilus TaxID=225196 RepID=UPI00036E6EDA|nr:hypothetical protein [Geopsychrobacter electrodiphilus]
MRKIANLFLILFLVIAAMRIFTELSRFSALPGAIAGLNHLLAILLFLLAVAVYFGLGLNCHLVKAQFVPLLVYLCWGLLDFWPLEPLIGVNYALYAALGQLLLGMLVLRSIRRQNGSSWLLTAGQFAGPSFSGAHLLRFCLLGLPLLPLILLLLGFATGRNLVESYTAGFVRLKPNGLYMIEKVYARGDKEIRLVAMIHLARPEFYADLSNSFNSGPSLLLAEGVSDTQGLLRGKFSYGNLAELLDLDSQEHLRFPGHPITAASLDLPLTAASAGPDILRADIDAQDFDPRTIDVLKAVGTYLLHASSPGRGYQEFSQWAREHLTPEINQVLMADLLLKRNRAVLSYLAKGLHKYRTILIPWGAMHMPGLEAGVKARGFVLRGSRERLSIDFFRLPYGQLWERLTQPAEGAPISSN